MYAQGSKRCKRVAVRRRRLALGRKVKAAQWICTAKLELMCDVVQQNEITSTSLQLQTAILCAVALALR